MILKYAAAKGMLSFAALMLLAPFLLRARRREGVFSAAVGIILYTVVKSIIVECGWGFSAAGGVYAGLAAEAVMLGCGIAFFSQLRIALSGRSGEAVYSCLGVVLVLTGQNMLADIHLIPYMAGFTVGQSAVSALLVASVYLISDACEEKSGAYLAASGAACAIVCFASDVLVGQAIGKDCTIFAPMLIMAGCCNLTVFLSAALKKCRRDLSAGGLAAGFMLSYCFDCLAS